MRRECPPTLTPLHLKWFYLFDGKVWTILVCINQSIKENIRQRIRSV